VACDGTDEDAPLDVLVNHALLEIDSIVERGRERFVLDGREAIRATIDARVDGVPVSLILVVLKKDGCVVDAQLAAAASELSHCAPDFARFVAGIAVTRKTR
jgi:hypothetical protein